jgi:hypothetical protein
MVANRRAWDMGAAAFNDPSPPLSLSLAIAMRGVSVYAGARPSGRLFLCELRTMLVSSGSAGVSRASDIQQRPAAGA